MFTAVIIEPRIHPALKIVLNNFNRNLDDNWEILIYCGIDNNSFVNEITKSNEFLKRKINVIQMNVNNLTIDEYNRFMYTKYYYSNINSEMFLVFQIDTLLSDKYSKNIYDFFEYDYVGAPWNRFGLVGVGNGGFSLRRKSKMIEMIEIGGFIKENGEYHYEDRFFSNTCKNIYEDKIILKKPSVEESKKFSVETLFYNESIGIHKPWLWLNNEELNQLKNHFFDLENLILSFKR
jgi:hypothetical protein